MGCGVCVCWRGCEELCAVIWLMCDVFKAVTKTTEMAKEGGGGRRRNKRIEKKKATKERKKQ